MNAPHSDDRLAQWGALAGGLAHEIRNPLSTMNISLQLLREDLRDRTQVPPGRVLPRVDLLISEIQRLQRIVNDFLKLAQTPELHLQERDANTLVEEIADFVQPEFDMLGIELTTHVDRTAGKVVLDSDLIRQALLNILRNAAQAMGETSGGGVTIQTRGDATWFHIDVVDTGPGMSKEVQARVFDGFFSTRPGGTGIGLAVTRQICQLHSGNVTCQSAVGHGTKFTLSLPVRGPDPSTGPRAAANDGSPPVDEPGAKHS